MQTRANRPTIAPAGLALGIGLGGFLDGILLHQVLQWHSMLSARLPLTSMANMKANMTADGLFHAFTWLMTLAGIALLWKALRIPHDRPPSGKAFIGTMLAGWGWFNLVEGLLNHHLLGLHHLLEALGPSMWDWLFLGSGVLLILVGHRTGRSVHVETDVSR